MKNCKYCGAPLDDDSQFCANCGKKIELQVKTCPRCGADVEGDSAFCAKCGMKLDAQVISPVNTPQVVIPATPSHEAEEEIVYEVEEEKDRKWWYIIGGIVVAVILVFGGYYLFMHNNKNISTPNVERAPIALKGNINETIGFSMKLKFKGNDVEGTEHYDKQEEKDTLSIKGIIDENGNLILHEHNNNIEYGTYEGILSDETYSGTFTNSRGKSMHFSAQLANESDLAKENNAIQMISKKGTLIANINGNIYYLDKAIADNMYEDDGDNCGKIYIYNIANGTTSYEKIVIPSGENYYSILDYKYRDMKITFVLYDVGRNGFGVENYCTEVSQYNIKTGRWEIFAESCSKAVFIDNNRKIKITHAEITNYDEAECAADYEYEYSDTIFDL